MNQHYTARIYCGTEEIAQKSGDDGEQLYVWMLTYADGVSGEIHGKVIDNETNQVIKQFKKQPLE